MKLFLNGRIVLSMCAVSLWLAACGDSSSLPAPTASTPTANPPPPVACVSDVPSAATSSSTGATAFVKTVASAASETAEPLTVCGEALAASETDEPDASI